MANNQLYPELVSLFKFPFNGKNWQKYFLIGSLLIFAGMFIPVIPWIFVCGYALSIMKQSMQTNDLELPSWDDISKLGIDGLRGSLISFLFMLPGSLIFFGGMGTYFLTSMIVPILMEVGHYPSQSMAIFFTLTMFLSLAILSISMFFGTILLIAGSFSLPISLSHFVAEERLAAAFHFRSWFRILRKNKWGYLITWILVSGVTVISYTLLMLMYYSIALCCMVPWILPPVTMYLIAIYAALFGKIYSETAGEGLEFDKVVTK